MRQLCNRKILTEEKIFVQKCRSLTDRIFFYSLEKYPCANKRNSLYYREMSVWKNEEKEELIMKLTTVKEIYRERDKYLDQEITVGGWVRSVRDSKTFGFVVLHDGTYFETLQIVYHDTMDNFAEISKLNVGAAIIVKGTLVATPQAKQPFEIQAAEISVEGTSAPDYPLQKKRHSLEYLRTITHLRSRTNTFQAVFRVRSLCAYAIHKFFQERGFVYVHTPLITGSDCEGAGEMFQVTTTKFE